MNELVKKVNSLAESNKLSKNNKQIIDDIIQLLYNNIYSGYLNYFTGSYYKLIVDKKLTRELSEYQNDLPSWEALQECSVLFMHQMKSRPLFTDFLAEIYTEHLGDRLGQFMTPPDVADLLVALNPITDSDTHSAHDPTAGTGGLILAHLRHVYANEGKEGIKRTEVHLNDIDPAMVKACAIQIILPSIMHKIALSRIEIGHGNILLPSQDLQVLAIRTPFSQTFEELKAFQEAA